jgi:hypothetical protein
MSTLADSSLVAFQVEVLAYDENRQELLFNLEHLLQILPKAR